MGQISDFQTLMANFLILKVSLALLFQEKEKKKFSVLQKNTSIATF